MAWFAKYVAPHAEKPSTGFWGFIVRRMMLLKNTEVSKATFEKLQAKGSDNVLEIGFGYGQGISYGLDKTLRSGSGKVFGVDHSPTACEAVKQLLTRDINNGKLQIFNADVGKMPIEDETIDKVFHTNCYYFWPNKTAAATEIKRVMKPGGLMIAGMNFKNVEEGERTGILKGRDIQPETYMDALRDAGFKDVHKKASSNESSGAELIFMYATKP